MDANKIKDKISIIINLYSIKKYDEVIKEANRILKKNPNIDLLWNILGLSYQQKGDLEKAEKSFFR